MKICTIEQAKANAALIRTAIEHAETLRDEKRVVYARIRQDRTSHDYGSDAWLSRNDRLHAMLDALSTSMGKLLITANSMLADMADTLITDESSTEMLTDFTYVTEEPEKPFSTASGLSITDLHALAKDAGIDTNDETELIEFLHHEGISKEDMSAIIEGFRK